MDLLAPGCAITLLAFDSFLAALVAECGRCVVGYEPSAVSAVVYPDHGTRIEYAKSVVAPAVLLFIQWEWEVISLYVASLLC